MVLSSMTGFARSHGVCGSYAWAWEIKSVNGKGLDLRLRLPSGWDAIEAARSARLSRVPMRAFDEKRTRDGKEADSLRILSPRSSLEPNRNV